MGEKIKGLVAAQGKLYVLGELGLYTFKNNGKEPNEWDHAHFSAAPTDRAFADFFFDEIHDLVNRSTILNEDRQELRDGVMVMVTEGFLPAYEDLRAIRAYKDDPRIPVLNRKKHYDDFARALWHGYKDLTPKVVSLLGYDVGFLFQRDGIFKTGLEAFVTENRGNLLLDVGEFLPRQRDRWQQELKTFRKRIPGASGRRRCSAGGEVLRTYLGRKGIRPSMADGCRVDRVPARNEFPPQSVDHAPHR